MQIYMHQTHHTMADFNGIFSYLENVVDMIEKNEYKQGLHLFPESYSTGYPLQDLCVQRSFIKNYLELIERIEKLAKRLQGHESVILFGGQVYEFDEDQLPLSIENVIYELSAKGLKDIYSKKLLPNYDIFDEKKYYREGNRSSLYRYQDKQLALLICEDMWYSSHHEVNPLDDLEAEITKNNIELDAIINLSASPFYLGKDSARLKRASEISQDFKCPFIYVNKVGAEDEILFDGSSFVLIGNKVQERASLFTPDVVSFALEKYQWDEKRAKKNVKLVNSWEGLFAATLTKKEKSLPTLRELSDNDCELILHSIKLGVQDYVKKTGLKNFLVALSGGIDSALVLAILKLIKTPEQNLEAIYMPGFFSATLSYDLSKELCENIGIKLRNLPIKFLHSNVNNLFKETFGDELDGLADENVQSRLRGALLYTRSNQTGAMVINTSNKSEIAVGYSTLYGDSVGALSILGDLYKTEVFALARYINRKYNNLLPEQIITRPPSAELREDQEDSHSLPPYERLDAILEGFLSYRYDCQDLINEGFNQAEVEKAYRLYNISEYKRKQFCPIVKLKAKSFGFGYRMPICKTF
ncbi:NAD(+) synthase [Halobacteriovorax sp. GB3]|uniref:NAD(+) synthase n=1 Tax=Halobacteriovorax sp. GB3 TaxID=2719615 RepID=UPI002362E279|nr:NAD(+) synthase [Halobacteriovorax sp. GB3]MDD0853487.1 NAD(+) synthase [Halobacteriovorax sp. GB3]